jgi:photosystem II stability/assembly factor-like uncharacterized protein
MSDTPMVAGQSSVWIQPGGPNTKPEFLGCHEVGDVEEAQGDVTLLYCPDPKKTGKFQVVGSVQGEQDTPTFSLSTTIKATADWLERITCPVPIFVHKQSCGRRDVFQNYDRSFAFLKARITSKTLTGLASRTPDNTDESMQEFELSCEAVLRILALTTGRQSIASVRDLTAVAFYGEASCGGECGPAADVCEKGVVAGKGDYAAKAALYVTDDGGMTWTAAAADPFAVGEDISALVTFTVGRSTMRILAARGTADGANPAEVAYSDNDGATWTLANVGSVNGQYVAGPQGMFALDQFNVWLVTNDGYIYKSEDGGVTWTAQESGVLNAAFWYAIAFTDALTGWVGGTANEIAMTEDGGTTWTAVTGPAGQAAIAVLSLAIVDEYTIWLGYDDGKLFYTSNGGVSWAQRTIPVAAADVEFITFANALVGYLVYNTAGGVGGVLRTIDGGYTWETISVSTTQALAAIHVCGINDAFAVGEVDGVTAIVLKIFA